MGKREDAISKMKASVKGLTGQAKPTRDNLLGGKVKVERKEEKLAQKYNLRAQVPVSEEQEEIMTRVARTLKKKMIGAPFVMTKGAVVRALIELLGKVEDRLSDYPGPRNENDLVEMMKDAIKKV